MKNTGAILGWKHNHAPGICTVDGLITEWPEALGPMPTQAQIDTWTAEYDTWRAAQQAVKDTNAQSVADAKADSVIQALVDIQTPAQCAAFCNNNFPTLTTPERAVMSKLVFALSVLAKQSLR